MNLVNTEKKELETSKQYMYRVLYENIMSLHLEPGKTISENDLALYLNVSRTPIREAISALHNDKLIDVKPQKGTFVSKLDLQLIEESFFMRKVLEKAIINEACITFTPAGIVELEKNLYFQEYYLKFPGTSSDFFKLDDEFHHIIYKHMQKENIWNAINRISSHFDRLRMLENLEQTNIQLNITQHSDILKAIKSKNSHGIDDLVTTHLSNYKTHLSNVIQNYKEYFQAK